MESEKNLYEVQVAGLPLKLRSPHDLDTVSDLISLVNEKVDEASAHGQNISFQNALLLASLHMAEDLLLLKKAAIKEIDRLEGRAQEVLSKLEDSPISRIKLDN